MYIIVCYCIACKIATLGISGNRTYVVINDVIIIYLYVYDVYVVQYIIIYFP